MRKWKIEAQRSIFFDELWGVLKLNVVKHGLLSVWYIVSIVRETKEKKENYNRENVNANHLSITVLISFLILMNYWWVWEKQLVAC